MIEYSVRKNHPGLLKPRTVQQIFTIMSFRDLS